MGTLGCINDMLQRDKENRALRKLSRGRMREHYKYLVKRKGPDIATVPYKVIEQMTHHPLTDAGIEKFQADYKAVFGE